MESAHRSHTNRTAELSRMYLPSPCVMPDQQYHLFAEECGTHTTHDTTRTFELSSPRADEADSRINKQQYANTSRTSRRCLQHLCSIISTIIDNEKKLIATVTMEINDAAETLKYRYQLQLPEMTKYALQMTNEIGDVNTPRYDLRNTAENCKMHGVYTAQLLKQENEVKMKQQEPMAKNMLQQYALQMPALKGTVTKTISYEARITSERFVQLVSKS